MRPPGLLLAGDVVGAAQPRFDLAASDLFNLPGHFLGGPQAIQGLLYGFKDLTRRGGEENHANDPKAAFRAALE